MHNTDIIIIGAGPVGLFAIFQAGMLGMRCHVVDSQAIIGGQCSILYPEKPIYDIPAYPKIMAEELIAQLALQAQPFEPVYHLEQQVIQLKIEEGFFQITTSKNITITAKAVIIAAGCGSFGPNRPPLPNIEAFEGKSVFYFINNRNSFANKEIVIAGGGDSAVDWAISLSEIAKKIYLVHRREKFRAANESIRQLKELANSGKIELVINYQLDHLVGKDGILEAVNVKHFEGNIRTLPANILLPFFGLAQELGPIKNWELNLKTNHIIVEPSYFETNISGIYAIGDIASYPAKLKLILTGFAEAASSLHHAYGRVFEGKALHFEYSTTKGVHKLVNERSNIINGKYVAEQILSKLRAEINLIKEQHKLVPTLAIILVGDNPASSIYVRNKIKAAGAIGMNALQINLPSEIDIDHMLHEISMLNNDSNISGIIVQLPLPEHINKNLILSAIDPSKDVDGFHPINVGYLHSNSGNGFIPCTALGCIELLKQVEPNLAGKNAVVIGRSNIVGKPLSALLLREDCTVTICHSRTQNLSSITSHTDIVISAIGYPLALTKEYFSPNSIVIDVGISKLPNSDKMVGDVDFTNVVDKVRYITPVPGGVGPMTVAYLLKNTLKAAKQNITHIRYKR